MSYYQNSSAVVGVSGVFATGAIGWFGTAIAGGANWKYSILNGIATIVMKVPATIVTQATAVTIANPLPAGLNPGAIAPMVFNLNNTTDADRSVPITISIAANGTISMAVEENLTANDVVGMNAVVQYAL
jgi:hypothetical protein